MKIKATISFNINAGNNKNIPDLTKSYPKKTQNTTQLRIAAFSKV